MNARGALGRYGEDVAVRQLMRGGITVLERNWRCRDGELDIVAQDGDALVVCEVKTRRAGGYEHPMAAVTPRRAERLRRLAARWLTERWLARYGAPPIGGVRIDLVGITLPRSGGPILEHARGVA